MSTSPLPRNSGWIRLHRKLDENPIWTCLSPAVLKVAMGMFMKANYQATKWYDGREEIDIPRGSFITSYQQFALYTKLTCQQVRDAFFHLGRLGIATYTRTPRYTIVHVTNYGIYNPLESDRTTPENRVENSQRNTTQNTPENTVGTQSEHQLKNIRSKEGKKTDSGGANYDCTKAWEWATSEYPEEGEVNPFIDFRVFAGVICDENEEKLLRQNLPLWKDCKKWKSGFVKTFRNFISERLYRTKPAGYEPPYRPLM